MAASCRKITVLVLALQDKTPFGECCSPGRGQQLSEPWVSRLSGALAPAESLPRTVSRAAAQTRLISLNLLARASILYKAQSLYSRLWLHKHTKGAPCGK
ncbi:unnamed protein product [Polarella glacialis]|uniref:Uncharacterized protein n=1 Tax=Polarella glacialis TaxID=89957 RepID=A0A813HJI9_POLGL|nr:unnamed protein product [Polarella glacialis]